jgi:hypothetical protein
MDRGGFGFCRADGAGEVVLGMERQMLTPGPKGLVGWLRPVPAGRCPSGVRDKDSLRLRVESERWSRAAVAVES